MDLASELDGYFQRVGSGQYAGHFKNQVNLLSRVKAETTTKQFSAHPTRVALGGYVLDDLETSDCHVLLTKSPVAGQVLYLCHDGDTRIVFASLGEFVDAADRALAEGCWLTELHPVCSPLSKDQPGLVALIRTLCEDAEGEDIAVQLIPSLDLCDFKLLERLALAANFFLAEAVAVEIEKRPRPDLMPVAELCVTHSHCQAANAGIAAVSAIRAIR